MTLLLMPDVEVMLRDFLIAQVEVTAIVGTDSTGATRIYKASLPKDPVGPLVKIHRIGGAQLIREPAVLDESRVQLDCYGGSQHEANRLAETIRAVVSERAAFYQHSDGQMLSAFPDPPFWLPDINWNTDRGGPKPRYILDITVRSRVLH